MENMVGKDFISLAHRIVYSYIGIMPEYKHVKSDLFSEDSQRQLYEFIKNMDMKLCSTPELIGLPIQPDDSYHDWELQNRKPDLISQMRIIRKKTEEFITLLVRIGELGIIDASRMIVGKEDMKLSKSTLSKFYDLGIRSEVKNGETVFWIDKYPHIFPAWKYLSSKAIKSGNQVFVFSLCMLDPEYPYSKDILYKLIKDEVSIKLLEEFLNLHQYQYVDSRGNGLSMDWVKNYDKKDGPLKDSWAEREHGGLSVFYDYTKKNQIIYGLRIPEFKEIMAHFDEMDEGLKSFVIDRTKKCDHCGYCTQTDKTGERARQLVNVEHNGNNQLCLLFPGFYYRWISINEDTVKQIMMFLLFADKVLQKRNVTKGGRNGR
jgi:hypothetical protein